MRRLVVVTGASRGLGFALAQEFLQGGYDVVISSKDVGMLHAAEKELARYRPCRLYAISMDMHDEGSIDQFSKSVLKLGYASLILVNNAGVGHTAPVDRITEEDFRQAFTVNFFGHLRLLKAFLPVLMHGGAVINILSILALRPIKYWSVYSSAKSALAAFMISLQMEYRHHGINILNVFPGKLKTGFSRRALGDADVVNPSEVGGIEPGVLARKIYQRFSKAETGQLFYPWSMRLLFVLNALSIDRTTRFMNLILSRTRK